MHKLLKRWALLMALLALSSSSVLAQSYVSKWSAEGDANDSSGINHGSLSGNVWIDAAGQEGSAFHFNEGKVVVPDDNSLDITNFNTISLWFKTDQKPNDAGVLITKGSYQLHLLGPNNQCGGGAAGREACDGAIVLSILNGGSGPWRTAIHATDKKYHDGEWHHVVGMLDHDKKASIWVDGEFKGKANDAITSVQVNGNPVIIGNTNANTTQPFIGLIDEVAIYDRPFEPEEIEDIAAGGPLPGDTPSNGAPVAVAQAVEIELNAAGEGTLTAEAVNDGSSDPDGDELTLSLSQTTFTCDDLGEVTVTLTVSDGELSATATAVVTVIDVTPPTIESISEPVVVECSGLGGDAVSLSVLASDMCDDELDIKWFDEFDTLLGDTPDINVTFGLGEHWARIVVTDDAGNASEETVSVIVQDTTPAEIEAALNSINKPKSVKKSKSKKSKKSKKSNKSINSNLYFEVVATATDVCDENPAVTAFITQPLTTADVYNVKYKQDDKKVEIDIKIQESKIKVDLRGPDEGVLLSMLDVALAQGGFSVIDGQQLTLKSKELKEGSKSKKSDKSKKSKKSKKSGKNKKSDKSKKSNKGQKDSDPRKGNYKYEFDLSYTLEEVDGVAVRLVVSAVDASGNESEPVIVAPPKKRLSKVALTKTAVAQEEVESAYAFGLDQNHPNPFNPMTTIRYSLGEASEVRLIVYNVLGQQVRALTNAFQSAGQYEVMWDGRDALGRDVSSGLYLYRLQAGSNLVVRKMLFTK